MRQYRFEDLLCGHRLEFLKSMIFNRRFVAALLVCSLAQVTFVAFGAMLPGTRLQYVAISTRTDAPPPYTSVAFTYGPVEKVKGESMQWWQMEISTKTDSTNGPACVVRALTSIDPLNNRGDEAMRFLRYQLQVPDTGEILEYVDVHSRQALLPPWVDFTKYFVPNPIALSRSHLGPPETCAFLGHVLSLQASSHDGTWKEWANVKRLDLDREVLVGTGRNFKDAEGKRLPQTPQRTEYTYVGFTEPDYRTMIDAGINIFMVDGNQQQWVRSEPVFYLNIAPFVPRFPIDFYRANYIGMSMFMDEPASILTWDQFAQGKVKYFSDAVTLIEKRTTVGYDTQPWGRNWLHSYLAGGGFNFGEMKISQTECPVWETFFDRTFYCMKGGGSGIVHEGRYNLDTFNSVMERTDRLKRKFTTTEMLHYYYGFLRGGTRPFGKFWGMAIYGQCDTNIAPQAFSLAYDMGARYFWFWTSDHDHHVPWPEQLQLARQLKEYVAKHPRRSIYEPPQKVDTLITVPNGYFVSFDWSGWLHILDDRTGVESKRFQHLLQAAYDEVHKCIKRGEDFDFAVDDGRPIKGYRRVVKLSLE